MKHANPYVAKIACRSAKSSVKKNSLLRGISYAARFVWCLVAHGDVCHKCPEIWGRP